MRRFLKAASNLFFPVLLFLLVLTGSSANAQKAIPELWGQRVHDDAKALTPATVDQLEKRLKTYEDSTTNQIGILIVSSLEGEAIEEYSLKVAEKWKMGTAKNDNGVLLLVAVDDHKMRIEVGQGLEGALTDAQSNQIIRNEMAPAFRRGEYDAGVIAGVDGIIKTIAGEYKATADASDGSNNMSILEKIISGLFIFGILGAFTYTSIFSAGCSGWGLYVFLIPFYALFPWIIIGYPAELALLGIYIIGLPIAKVLIARTAWGKAEIANWASTKSSGGSSRGGWFSGGGGWSSGGGGFSGGGGSFGGGGSSGSW